MWWSIILLCAILETSASNTSDIFKPCCPDRNIPSEEKSCSNGSHMDIECKTPSYLILHETHEYMIKNGSLIISHRPTDFEYTISPQSYCTGFLNLPGEFKNYFRAAVVCEAALIDDNSSYEERHFYLKLYSYFLLISVLFLVATFLVYAFLPRLRDLHGRCLMCFVASLAIGYFSLAVLQQNFFNYDVSNVVCTVFGFWTYFWLLSVFFWLSIISFNLWYQSRLSTISTSVKDGSLWVMYLIFGFGVPILFQLGAILSHHIPNSFLLHPNIGNGVCWFQGMKETWLYFSGPMAVLLLCNLIFFILTTRILWIHYKETRPQPRIRTLRFKLVMYLKLFLTMGLTWIFELVSFTFQIDWYVSDILNSLQGPIIFILMVLTRKRVTRSLKCNNSCLGVFLFCSRPLSEQDDDIETEQENDIQLS